MVHNIIGKQLRTLRHILRLTFRTSQLGTKTQEITKEEKYKWKNATP